MAPFEFYIIYTPHTVSYFRLFALSLLKWTNCKYYLVSNGCTDEEVRMMKKLAARHEQLEVYIYTKGEMRLHHDVVNHLRTLSDSEYFCFMDSDIFATGNFIEELSPDLDIYSALFSCFPAWSQIRTADTSITERVDGNVIYSESGLCLGCSFFAIYHREKLNSFIDKSGIDFRRYDWEEVPEHYQQELKRLKIQKAWYDTGKLLNVLFQQKHGKVVFKRSQTLHHIGALSWYCTRVVNYEDVHLNFKRSLWDKLKFNVQSTINPDLKRFSVKEHQEKRYLLARYIYELLEAHYNGTKLPPPLEIDADDVHHSQEILTNGINELVKVFGKEWKTNAYA